MSDKQPASKSGLPPEARMLGCALLLLLVVGGVCAWLVWR